MEKIYVMFDEYNLNIKEKISISNSSPFKVDYIIEFKISPLELRSSNILDELLSKKSTIFCNDIEIGNKADFQHLCSSRDDFSSFEFRVIKKFFLSEPIHLYTNSGQVEFLNHLLKKKLNTLINLTKKITIITFKNGVVNQKGNKSSIFEFLDKSPENFNAQLIDEKTLNFINKNKESKLVLGTIPNILSEGIFNSLDILPIIKSFLQSLANESNSSKFYFKGKFNLIINVSNYYAKDKMLAHFQSLIKITKYINQSEVTADQKKTFLRKSICEDKVQDANLNLEDMDTAFFEKVYNDTTFLFDTFETGEVAVFLKEKKELLKEYLQFSNNISKHIDAMQSNLNKNILVILAAILTHILFKVRMDMSITQNIFIISSILIFLVFTWIFFGYKEYKHKLSLLEQMHILNKNFSFLSSKADIAKEDVDLLVKKNIHSLTNLIILSHLAFGFMALAVYIYLFILIIYSTY